MNAVMVTGPWSNLAEMSCFYRVWEYVTLNHVVVADLDEFITFEKVQFGAVIDVSRKRIHHLHDTCSLGHILTEENSVQCPANGIEYRRCKKCLQAYQRLYYRTVVKHRRKAARLAKKEEPR